MQIRPDESTTYDLAAEQIGDYVQPLWAGARALPSDIRDASHNIAGRPSQPITKIDHILAWFAKYPIDDTTDD